MPLTWGLAVLAIVVLTATSNALVTGENAGHAAGHLSAALPLAALSTALLRVLPASRTTRLARGSRRVTVVGLALVAASLVLEAAGALGFDGDRSAIGVLTTLHNTSWILLFPGVLAVVVGTVLSLASLLQQRAE